MTKIVKFGDFINGGTYNKVYHLDDEWVLKTPYKVGEGMHDNYNKHPYPTMKDVLINFNDHILMFKKYPSIFPKIKRLDKYRVAIEKCDVDKAVQQLKYVKKCINYTKEYDLLLEDLYMNKAIIYRKLEELIDDRICVNWYNFGKN